MMDAEYVCLSDKRGPLSSEPMIYNKETGLIYRVICSMEFLLETNCWRFEKCTSDGKISGGEQE